MIRGGSHWPQYHKNSCVYAACLQEVVVTAGYYYGYNVSLQLEGNTPKEDFYFMCHTRQFVVGVGGFSRTIDLMVKYRGGTIVGRSF